MQDVNDDLADMLEQADEVQEALGRQYGMPEIDDDELAAELDALGKLFIYVMPAPLVAIAIVERRVLISIPRSGNKCWVFPLRTSR